MRSLLRSIAVAAVVTSASAIPLQALTLIPSDTFNGPGAAGFSSVVTGGFTDDAVFTLVGPGIFEASFSATNSFALLPDGGTSGFIGNFVMSLFKGTPPPPGDGAVVPEVSAVPIAPGSQQVAFTALLTAGTYFLHFSGSSITGPAASYGGSVSIAQQAAPGETPLPTALPMFAAGLGGIGLLVWRQRRKSAATT